MRIEIALLATIGVAGCSSSAHETRAPRVEFACEAEECPVRFEGNTQVSDAELTAEMARRAPAPHDLFRDVAPVLVRAAYYDRGFVDARVDSHTEATASGGHVLVLAVREGNPYWVKRLSVSDPAVLPGEELGDHSSLRAALSQSEGAIFTRHVMLAELRTVLSKYREQGYAWADADVAVTEDPKEHSVSIDVTVARGPATTVDRVDVRGGDAIPDHLVQERLAVHPGDAYRASAIEATSRALTLLAGPARRVDVSQVPVAGHPDHVTVTFEVSWTDPDVRTAPSFADSAGLLATPR